MFLLMWMSLLFSLSCSNADIGVSLRQFCQSRFCITIPEGTIRAVAGLCVVIPCSFTTSYYFIPENLIWFKCDSTYRCSDSDMIFSKTTSGVQPSFFGRVSLLEPDLSQGNCSIIINDIRASDYGAYHLRVTGVNYYGNPEGFTYSKKAKVNVKEITQKPSVMIPTLTEGLQATLICIAPGLCSGSAPKFTWTFRGPGANDSHIPGNVSTFRHTSTLTFTPSARHHGNRVICKVSFSYNANSEKIVTLNVIYKKEVEIKGNTNVKEGETLNLTCRFESFPPSPITWMKSVKKLQDGQDKNLKNITFTSLENVTETSQQMGGREATFSILNVSAADSGQYVCTAQHLNSTVMAKVDVHVKYMKTLIISGNTTVGRGDALNLTCSLQSFPLSFITWTSHDSNTHLQSDSGSATLVIPDMGTDQSGRYICTAKYLERTEALFADVTVAWIPSIFPNSGCEIQSDVLTCVCFSEGFPLPDIRWPLLTNQNKYSVMTSVTNLTVNSRVTLTVKNHSNISAECLSSNQHGETKQNLPITNKMPRQDDHHSRWKMFSKLEVIVAFFLGVLLSAIICLLAVACHRKRQRISANLNDKVETVTSQEDLLMDAVENNQIYNQAVADGEEAVEAEKAAFNLDGIAKDVMYASINLSLLKRKSGREAAKTQETEYAEIKPTGKEQGDDNGGEDGDVLEEKEEEVMMGENLETEHYFQEEEEEGDDMAVYSNVEEIMEEV